MTGSRGVKGKKGRIGPMGGQGPLGVGGVKGECRTSNINTTFLLPHQNSSITYNSFILTQNISNSEACNYIAKLIAVCFYLGFRGKTGKKGAQGTPGKDGSNGAKGMRVITQI